MWSTTCHTWNLQTKEKGDYFIALSADRMLSENKTSQNEKLKKEVQEMYNDFIALHKFEKFDEVKLKKDIEQFLIKRNQ